MSEYIVTDTELTGIANAIRTKGGTSAPLEFPGDFVDAIDDISTGGAELISSNDYAVNTSSETQTTVATLTLPDKCAAAGKILYVRIRDKAGPRTAYFTGADAFYINDREAKGATSYTLDPAEFLTTRKNGAVRYTWIIADAINGYGVWAGALNKRSQDGRLTLPIYAIWSSSSGSINGTFNVSVYLLDYPDGCNPFDYTFGS